MFFFLSGAGKGAPGTRQRGRRRVWDGLVVMFFLGVDTAFTNFVQQTKPPCLQSTIAPTSVPPPPDSHSPIQHTSTRQTQVQRIANRGRTPSACAGQAPSGPGSIYPGPPSSPLARIAPPFLQRCGGSFPASPTSRRCDAAPWAAAGTVDRCNGGAVSCQWILFPMAMTSSSCHRLQSCRCRQRGHSQTQLLFPRPLPVIIIITTRPYQASSSRCG